MLCKQCGPTMLEQHRACHSRVRHVAVNWNAGTAALQATEENRRHQGGSSPNIHNPAKARQHRAIQGRKQNCESPKPLAARCGRVWAVFKLVPRISRLPCAVRKPDARRHVLKCNAEHTSHHSESYA